MHISLADLMELGGSSALLQEWTAGSGRSGPGTAPTPRRRGGGGAWLDGDAAEAVACDAAMVPFVTGEVDPGALEDLIRLCVQLDRLRHHPRGGGGPASDGPGQQRRPRHHRPRHRRRPDSTGRGPAAAAPDTARAWEALERAIIGKAVDLLSGPGGLASFLRRRQLGARLGGPSLPLDIGFSQSIPAGIRNAVTLGTSTASGPDGCNQPASACEVHHVKHKNNGGTTSTKDCVLLCLFHHQIVIHKWGWTLVLNPDGTTTAWNPDKTKVLHSHSPPVSPG